MKFLLLTMALFFSSWTAQAIDIPAGLSDQQTIDFLIPHFNAKTGRSLDSQVIIWEGSHLGRLLQADRDFAELKGYFAITHPVIQDLDNLWQKDLNTPGNMNKCLIIMALPGEILTGRARQTILAHELYHCYQFQKIGAAGVEDAGDWLIEGGANYVGESVVGGTYVMGSWWGSYLTETLPLIEKTYAAFGLYFHLEGRGIDPWQLMEVVLAFTGTTEQKFNKLREVAGFDAMATWTMSLARHPDWGSEWQAVGKDIPPHSAYPAQRFTIDDGAGSTMNFDYSRINHYSLTVSTTRPIRFESNGMIGQIRIINADNVVLYESRIENLSRREFCAQEYCGCPSGDEAVNLINVNGAARIIVTGVGINMAGSGTLVVSQAVPACCEGSRSLDPRLVGTWMIETQPLVEHFMFLQFPGQTRSISGSQTMRISRNGVIAKQTSIHMATFIPASRGIVESMAYFSESGSFTGCLETKPYPGYPSRFSFTITQVSDGVNQNWGSTYGASNAQRGEHIVSKWGPSEVDNHNSDQSAYGDFISDSMLGIRGTTVRRFRKVTP